MTTSALPLALGACGARALRPAVLLPAIAHAADHNLRSATGTQKQSSARRHGQEVPTSAGGERVQRSILDRLCESTVVRGTASERTLKSAPTPCSSPRPTLFTWARPGGRSTASHRCTRPVLDDRDVTGVSKNASITPAADSGVYPRFLAVAYTPDSLRRTADARRRCSERRAGRTPGDDTPAPRR